MEFTERLEQIRRFYNSLNSEFFGGELPQPFTPFVVPPEISELYKQNTSLSPAFRSASNGIGDKYIYLDIQNINRDIDEGDFYTKGALGVFIKPYKHLTSYFVCGAPVILLAWELIEAAEEDDNNGEPEIGNARIASTLLHEMIHLYCFKHGIDDSNHNEAFANEADAHGLWAYPDESHNYFRTILECDNYDFWEELNVNCEAWV